MKKTTGILASSIAAILAASPAFAQEESGNKTGFSMSIDIANLEAGDLCKNLRRGLLGITQLQECSDSEVAYGLSGDYWFNEHFAVEVGGLFASGFDFTLTDNSEVDEIGSADYRSFFLGGRGRIPLGEVFSVFAKAGFHLWDAEYDTRFDDDGNPGLESSFSTDADGADPYFGIGAEFQLTDKLSMTGEYTRYLADGEFGSSETDAFEDVNVINGSLVYTF